MIEATRERRADLLLRPRLFWVAVLSVFCAALSVPCFTAGAVPSFAKQTGQPCAACHVGAVGPQLTQFGRDFKLYGYVAVDTNTHFPPLAIVGQSAFTKTEEKQEPPPPWYGSNDNIEPAQQVVLFYAGRVLPEMGAYLQLQWNGGSRNVHLDNSEVRYSHDRELFGEDFVYGVTLNNGPGVSDIWNTFSAFAYPYVSVDLAPGPSGLGARVDGGISQQVLGTGLFASWNSLLYLELAYYKGLSPDLRNVVGNAPTAGTDQIKGNTWFGRTAIEHGWAKGEHYIEVGAFGMTTHVSPQSLQSAGNDAYFDAGVDATYQWFINPKLVTSDYLSAHAAYIREHQDLTASQVLFGTNSSDRLSVYRADVSYAIAATYTPTLQYFRTMGTTDPTLYPVGNFNPDSTGMIAELAYVPWGKPGDDNRYNMRFALQYTNYFKYNGTTSSAHNYNTIFFNVTWDFALNP